MQNKFLAYNCLTHNLFLHFVPLSHHFSLYTHPSPKQPLSDILSPSICLSWTFPTMEWANKVSYVCLLSLSIMVSRSFLWHNTFVLFFIIPKRYSAVFFHTSVDGFLSCFQFLVIMANDAMKIHAQILDYLFERKRGEKREKGRDWGMSFSL